MVVPKDKIGEKDWIQMTDSQWHKVKSINDSQIFTCCSEVLKISNVVALLSGVRYPGIFPYECTKCSPRMDHITVLTDENKVVDYDQDMD